MSNTDLMLVWRPPTLLFAYTAAIVAGVLLAIGSYVGGAILVVIALLLTLGDQIARRRGEDDEISLF